MSKYYKPSIEEFHVGFEFETLETDRDGSGNKSWNKWKLGNQPTFLKHIFDKYYGPNEVEGSVRVKKLDREDIESLGWAFDKTSIGETQLKFFKDNLCLYYRENEHQVGIFTLDPSKCGYYSKYNVDPCRINTVTIMNKSELKRILLQINVVVPK